MAGVIRSLTWSQHLHRAERPVLDARLVAVSAVGTPGKDSTMGQPRRRARHRHNRALIPLFEPSARCSGSSPSAGARLAGCGDYPAWISGAPCCGTDQVEHPLPAGKRLLVPAPAQHSAETLDSRLEDTARHFYPGSEPRRCSTKSSRSRRAGHGIKVLLRAPRTREVGNRALKQHFSFILCTDAR
jgi:hypothetical protein